MNKPYYFNGKTVTKTPKDKVFGSAGIRTPELRNHTASSNFNVFYLSYECTKMKCIQLQVFGCTCCSIECGTTVAGTWYMFVVLQKSSHCLSHHVCMHAFLFISFRKRISSSSVRVESHIAYFTGHFRHRIWSLKKK